MIGLNIKNLRTKNNMTQKELADKLFVTSQAVSRWENGEVEPSISTMNEIAKIFNISIDVLVNGDFETANEEADKKEPEKEVVVETKYVYDEPVKPVLAVCENCNTPIFDSNGIHRFKTSHRSGRTTHYTDHVYCTKCNDKRIADAKARKIAIEKGKAEVRKKRRMHSFVWPSIVAIGLLVYAIISFVSKNTTLGIWMCVASVSSFTFFACLILQNNVVGEVWVTVAGWSIKWPGLIFELSLDGIIWLITVKLTLAILSFLFGIAVAILATFIGAFISLFIYPFALRNNINNVETEHEEIDL